MIRFEIDSDDARKELKGIRDRLGDQRPALRRGAAAARRFLRRWHERRGEGSWKSLSRVTLRLRRNARKQSKWGRGTSYYRMHRGSGRRTLRWTGGLVASLSQKGAPGHVEEYTGKDVLIFGSDYSVTDYRGRQIEIVRIHQLGRGWNPRRTLLPRDRLAKFFVDEYRAMLRVQRGHIVLR